MRGSMITVQARLKHAMETGSLTVADLSIWFARDYHTVHGWIEKGREPWGPNGEASLRMLAVLEQAIKQRRGFPIPLHLSPPERRAHMIKVRRELDGSLSKARSAK